MEKREELELMMNEIIQQVSTDNATGISRFLQANPYTSFDFYNFSLMKDKPELFEQTLYYESENSQNYKELICDILRNPNGKNTFFLVGYQGCGKTTFIHSVINKYKRETDAKVIIVDCDKKGKDQHQIQKNMCALFRRMIHTNPQYSDFIDFYTKNKEIILELVDENKSDKFIEIIREINEEENKNKINEKLRELRAFINTELLIKDAFYLLILWSLACDYHHFEMADKKLMFFIDNLDCIDEYHELVEFVSCIDSLTVDMSEFFDKLTLCSDRDIHDSYVSKIKIFVAMRETTKANLPSSHFSNAFRSIYTYKDLTECYNKGEIIKNRVERIFEYDKNSLLKKEQKEQFKLIRKIIDDIYTENVIYPLFNNNYRSAVEILIKVVVSHTQTMKKYIQLMDLEQSQYKHGARGILFKFIFDEFNKSDGNEESCFKRIGVLDLLNRKNNSVSICRLILSYLSNYTETKCDSGINSISLKDIMKSFSDIFTDEKVGKYLCEMFALRDTVWSHLISFNQIEYKDCEQQIESYIDFSTLNPDKTMIHYSCAGKIYIEYVATHFEFFTVRVYKENRDALFCDSNLIRDPKTHNFKCVDIVDRICTEVEQCCTSLKKFNIELCTKNNYPDPYDNPVSYKDSHYICNFKRKDYDGRERRFKQFHEERIILTHINYIDCYRSYILNHCDKINQEEKLELNEKLTKCITRYIDLLASNLVLKNRSTNSELVNYYRTQIDKLEENWSDFSTIIRKNSD